MTLLTYADLTARVLRWIDEPNDTATTLAIVQDAINASHRRLLTSRQWPFMSWPQVEQITTTSGTRIYALNPNANRVYHLWDTTLKQYVPVIPRREWPAVGANQSNIGTAPFGVAIGPNWPVRQQPVTAGVVTAVSTSSSDTATTVVITGLDASGVIVSETLTLSGTTPVSGATSFVAITNLAKTGTWVGTLTLSSGATTLGSLLPAEPGRWYPTVEFLEDPESDRTFTYQFQRQPLTLTRDGDIPETPYPYSEIHVYDALLDLTTYNTELGGKEQLLWQKRYDELKDGLLAAFDDQIVGSYPKFVRDLDDKGVWSRVAVYNP